MGDYIIGQLYLWTFSSPLAVASPLPLRQVDSKAQLASQYSMTGV